CHQGWIPFKGSCYVTFVDGKNWYDAESMCRDLGGYLVKIESKSEDEFVSRELALPENLVWIGLMRSVINDSFVWVDGSMAKYTNWGVGEPIVAGIGKHCVQMESEAIFFYWKTASCFMRHPYVCER
ncbi:predicted protein, partial [Nematostella vectensis]